ncbi:MAG: Hsp20/alpha crystallin family protein [bacterium]|nr:Hsp20/alpha crystallin family protein [bacterium]
MAIVRWSPFRDVLGIRDEMDRLFDNFFARIGERGAFDTSWAPSVDIYETKDAVVIDAELPGIKQNDISVTVSDNVLTIKGEKKQEKEVKEENYHRVERAYGSFSRSFTLPVGVQSDKIKASYKDGVLKITLPKAEEAKPKQIPIEVK